MVAGGSFAEVGEDRQSTSAATTIRKRDMRRAYPNVVFASGARTWGTRR